MLGPPDPSVDIAVNEGLPLNALAVPILLNLLDGSPPAESGGFVEPAGTAHWAIGAPPQSTQPAAAGMAENRMKPIIKIRDKNAAR